MWTFNRYCISIFLFLANPALALEDGFTRYVDHQEKIELLSSYVRKLALRANADDLKFRAELGRASAVAAKYCSDSFESQLYHKARLSYQGNQQGLNSVHDEYTRDLARRRKKVYKRCKTLSTKLSEMSLETKVRFKDSKFKNMYNEQKNIWADARAIYIKVKSIESPIINKNLRNEENKHYIHEFYQLKKFTCNFEREEKLFSVLDQYLEGELAEAYEGNRKLNVQALTSMRQQVQRRHRNYRDVCFNIQERIEYLGERIKRAQFPEK